MYINTKHLQILDVIKRNSSFTIKDISQLLNMSTQHAKAYIEDIYSELFNSSSKTLKSEEIIECIFFSKNAKNKLRAVQIFTKNQNIFYMLFLLGKYKHFKLAEISKELGITTRNLNNYSQDIKNILDFFTLNIEISNRGIDLTGSSENINRFRFYLYYKFLVEKDYLPKKLRDEFVSFSKIQNFKKAKIDIKKLIEILNCKNTAYSEFVYLSLYVTHKEDKSMKRIKELSLEEALIYKPDDLESDSFNKTFKFLKKSIFKNMSCHELKIIFMACNKIQSSEYFYSTKTSEYFERILPIFNRYLGESINSNFPKILKSFIFYCEIKNTMFIDDSYFINLNLSHLTNSNFLGLTKDIQKILPSFSFLETLTLWYSYSEKLEKEENNIFVFKYLNLSIVPALIKEIYKKHNIEIKDFVNIKNLNSYLKNNKVDNLILVENIKLYQKTYLSKNFLHLLKTLKKFVKY